MGRVSPLVGRAGRGRFVRVCSDSPILVNLGRESNREERCSLELHLEGEKSTESLVWRDRE